MNPVELLGLGAACGGVLILCLLGGHLLDDVLGTTPLFLLLGLGMGILLSVVGAYQRIRRYLS